jgi:hypothetical protein
MDRPFTDATAQPTAPRLESVLGGAFGRYESLLVLATGFANEWNYSNTGGWMLKVHDGKKALFYLIPLEGGFKISMAIRESEREALMADHDLEPMEDALVAARKFSEGFGVQFDVDGATDFAVVESFMCKLIAVRR